MLAVCKQLVVMTAWMDQAVIRTSGFPKAIFTGGRSREAVRPSIRMLCPLPCPCAPMASPPSVDTSKEGLASQGTQGMPVTLLTGNTVANKELFPSCNRDGTSQLANAKARAADQRAAPPQPEPQLQGKRESRKLTFLPKWET